QPRHTLAATLASRLPVPAGMHLNTIESDAGMALVWATQPPHQDVPATTITPATTLYLVEPLKPTQ
ncbi:hypothetical protein MTR62_06885, partial [Novosphingobium sp. 1949]